MYSGSFDCRKERRSLDLVNELLLRDDISYQALVTRYVLSSNYHRLTHCWMLTQHRFNL